MKYLFRGKQTGCDSWVFGYLADYNLIFDIDTSHFYTVDEKTVGLWSGCYDIRGMKIFENDIIKDLRNGVYYTVKFEYGEFIVEDDLGCRWDLITILNYNRVKICGNSYEAE